MSETKAFTKAEKTIASTHDGAPEEDDQTATTVETFDEMNLNKDLLRGIYAYGFEKPSVIQQRAILPLISGNYDRPVCAGINTCATCQ